MNRVQLEKLGREQLIRRCLYVEDQWQRAADEKSRAVRSGGSHVKPKKRGRPDKKSFEHSIKDTSKSGAAGGGILLVAAINQIAGKIESGRIDLLDAIAAVPGEIWDPWGVIVLMLVAAHFTVLLAIKTLSEFP